MKLFLGLCALWAAVFVLIPIDDTDASWYSRSGMSLHTDQLTGCQYLSVMFGGMVPRTDGNGKQIGCRKSS